MLTARILGSRFVRLEGKTEYKGINIVHFPLSEEEKRLP